MKNKRIIIGWNEWCSMPEIGIPAIRAKIDTGAQTSAIHAEHITTFERDGEEWVRFTVRPISFRRKLKRVCEAPLIGKRTVISSNGHKQKRYVISTTLKMGGSKWQIELTLARRETMTFRMLLGRQALASQVMIEPDQSLLLHRYTREEINSFYPKQR